MPTGSTGESTYSSWVGVIYVFNLIVGTGALTLPAAFAKAGWLLSTITLVLLSFVSFITVTFVIESIACANATVQWRMIQSHKIDEESDALTNSNSEVDESNEHTAIIPSNRNRSKYYSLNEKMELGHIANLYFNKWGTIFFYGSLCVYLYGDLAIYAAVIGKSLADVICTRNVTNASLLQVNAAEVFDDSCWENSSLQIVDVYRICVASFTLLVGPFAYFNVQKTKYTQIFTTTMRWCAFIIMVTLACVQIQTKGQQGFPQSFEFNGLAALLGASIYSFMCHHSLPDLIAPFSDKRYLIHQLGLDYVLISAFYLLLALTGIFAFKELNDLYTLNFVPDSDRGVFMKIILYYLSMFPVFTLSTSFPIIAITLQSNLKACFLDTNTINHCSFLLRRLTFPTIALIPPVVVALCTHNLHSLVKFTGAYAGVCIQYFIPALLVLVARNKCQRDLGKCYNKYASKFQGLVWIVFVIGWGVACIILVTVNFISP